MIPHGYLIHHGIIGQKWGVRRYQNKDGSLTSSGKERYGKSGSNDKKDFNKMSYSEEQKYAKKQGVPMLKDLRKIIDKYGDDYVDKYDEFVNEIQILFNNFEHKTGYSVADFGASDDSGSTKWHVRFARRLQEPDYKNDRYFQDWTIYEDDSEPGGYRLDDVSDEF